MLEIYQFLILILFCLIIQNRILKFLKGLENFEKNYSQGIEKKQISKMKTEKIVKGLGATLATDNNAQ